MRRGVDVSDVLYERGMGYEFDPDDIEAALGNGTAGYTPPTWDELHPYAMDGSDLFIGVPSSAELAKFDQEVVDYLARYNEGEVTYEELPPVDVVKAVLADTQMIYEEYDRQLKEMQVVDKQFAAGLSTWVTTERSQRAEKRGGKVYAADSPEAHEETINILDDLLLEIKQEEHGMDIEAVLSSENARLKEMIQTWREETFAQMTMDRLHELYRLVA